MTDDTDLDLDRLVPLGALVAEGLDASVDQLARRIGDDVFLDDVGMRCCTRETARALFAERAGQQAAQDERDARAKARQADAAAAHNENIRAMRERNRALGERQKSGHSALADMYGDER